MALIFQQRVESFTGNVNDPPLLNHMLTQGAREVIIDVPKDSLQTLYVELTDAGSGISTIAHRIIEVHKAGYRAMPFRYSELSILDFVDTSPGYYTFAGTTYIKPGGGTIIAVAFPTVTAEMSSVTGAPFELENLFVLRTAVLWLEHMIACVRGDVVTTITMPTVPTAPGAPAIAYTDAAAVAPSAVTIATLPAVPSFATPSFGGSLTLPTLPTDLDLTTKIDGITALNPPTAPAAPSITAANSVVASVAATTIGAMPTSPTFTKPTFGGSLSLPTLPTLDLTKEIDGLTALDPPAAPAAPAISYVNASAGTITAQTMAALPTAPVYTAVSPSLTFTDWDTEKTNEDPEMMLRTLEKVRVELGEANAKIADNANAFQDGVEEYRAELQKRIADLGAAQDTQEKQAALTTDVALKNAAEKAVVDLRNYEQSLRHHDASMAIYAAEIARVDSDYRLAYQKAVEPWSVQQRMYIDNLRVDIENEIARFRKDEIVYDREVTKLLAQAQTTLQEALQNSRLSTEGSISDKDRTLRASIEDFMGQIRRYEPQHREYISDIDRQLQQIEFNFKKAFDPWTSQQRLYLEKYGRDTDAQRVGFQGNMQDHMREVDRILEGARIARSEAQQTAQNATDVNLRNKAQTMAALLSDYQMKIELYRSQLTSFSAEVTSTLGKTEQETVNRQRQIRMLQSERREIDRSYERSKRQFIRTFSSHRPLKLIHQDF